MNINILMTLTFIFLFNITNAKSGDVMKNGNSKNMKTKLYVVNSKSKSNETVVYFESFNERFNYLKRIELIFQPGNEYDKYQEDLNTIQRGWSETAEIIDTRELIGYEQDPVRLLLTDNFFDLSVLEKDEAILHELGHYFTNPSLITIRKYIAVKNPPIVNTNQPDLQELINAHNSAMNYVFQIPKLSQEVNAELWVYKHERKYSKSRIKRYCDSVEQSLNEFRTAKVNESWFYEIPRLNFLLLWRLAIFQSLDFDYIDDCIQKTQDVNIQFKNLAKTVSWDKLKIFTMQQAVLNDLENGKCNSQEFISEFELIYDDYILNSARFFPINMKNQLIEFYKKNH